MKKIILAVSALVLSAALCSAQDLQKATELAKQANEALVNGDHSSAIENFTAALEQATACTEADAEALASSCRKGICQANYSYANNLVDENKMAEAISQLGKTIEVAAANNEEEIVEKANALLSQVHQAYANEKIKAAGVALKAKDAVTAKACYQEALEQLNIILTETPDNGKALLQKGQVQNALGSAEAALDSYFKAAEAGLKDDAYKAICKIYEKKASAALKTKDYSNAIAIAEKALEYGESANAYKIAGTAANANKDVKAAIEYFSKYLEIKPDDNAIKQAVEQLKAIANK